MKGRHESGRVIYTDPHDWVVIPDAVPAIIERDDWERAQVMIARRAQAKGGRGKQSNRWLLSGLLRCGDCTHPYWGERKRKGVRAGQSMVETNYYTCSGRRGKGKAICAHSAHVRADDLETWVLGKLTDLVLADAEGVDEAVARFAALAASDDGAPSEADRLAREIAEVDATVNALVSGIDPANMPLINDRLTRLRKKKEHLQRELRAAKAVTTGTERAALNAGPASGSTPTGKMRQFATETAKSCPQIRRRDRRRRPAGRAGGNAAAVLRSRRLQGPDANGFAAIRPRATPTHRKLPAVVRSCQGAAQVVKIRERGLSPLLRADAAGRQHPNGQGPDSFMTALLCGALDNGRLSRSLPMPSGHPTPSGRRLPLRFRDREAVLKSMRGHLHHVISDSTHLAVLNLVGLGGAGKTSVLQEFTSSVTSDTPKVAVVRLTLERTRRDDPAAVLLALREHIGADCLLFDSALSSYWSAVARPFTPRKGSGIAEGMAVRSIETAGSVTGVPLPIEFAVELCAKARRAATRRIRYQEAQFEEIDELRGRPDELVFRV